MASRVNWSDLILIASWFTLFYCNHYIDSRYFLDELLPALRTRMLVSVIIVIKNIFIVLFYNVCVHYRQK